MHPRGRMRLCHEEFCVFGDSYASGTQDAGCRTRGNKVTVSVYTTCQYIICQDDGVLDVNLFQFLSFAWSVIIKV